MRSRVRRPSLTSLTVILILTISGIGFGQGSTPQRGFHPGGSYVMSDIETINTNLLQGNLMLNFPLAKLPPGRNGLTAGIYLRYDSKLYDSRLEYYPDYEYGTPPNPVIVERNVLNSSAQGGWRYGMGYELQLINRLEQYQQTPQYPDMKAIYRWKVKMVFPDGSVHEFLPRGFGAQAEGDGYYNFRPDGWQTVWQGAPFWTPADIPGLVGATHYYTFDGSYLRLDVEHDADDSWWNNPWTLTFPDGTKVSQSPTQPQRITDRNGNYVELVGITYNGNPAMALRDQQNRQVVLESAGNFVDVVHNLGFGGVDLAHEVHWKILQVGGKDYCTVEPVVGPNPNGYPATLGTLNAVSEIRLPSQSGPIKYSFGYNAQDYQSVPWGTPSVGLGELSSITLLADGVQQYNVQYKYFLDNQYGPSEEFKWDYLLKNAVTQKTLTYNETYDGTTTPVTEVTRYPGGAVITPEGGVIYQVDDSQRTYATETPDGTVVEKVWAANTPQGFPAANQIDPLSGINTYDPARANGFVKWQITSIRDQNKNLVKSAIKEFAQDKNGNTTSISEYDWVPYGDVPRDPYGFVTGIPASAVKKRITTNTFARPTPNSTDTSSNTADSYWNYTAPNLRVAVSSVDVGTGTTTVSRTEFLYDNAATTGNVIQQKVWDSTKGAISNPLTTSNSISTTSQYDSNGNVILTTDAAGTQTSISYGAINGFTNLYPTQTVVASNIPSLARTTTNQYDFSTALVTRTTDVNNNVSTATSYDAFGRPTLVKVAENAALETRVVTEYSDLLRRVIVKSDLNTAGDGKLVTIQHYDPLGRVRLSRRLEDATTQSATNEAHGIKTQTRYRISNPCAPDNTLECLTTNANVLGSYTLVANSYRAATAAGASAETTMGWTRTWSDNAGRTKEVQTFGGTSLPAPWGSSTISTGTVTTAYDANLTTVSDQAQKQRRSVLDGLGRLVRVDEPDANGNLGAPASPTQPTHYTYDALNHLIHVSQSNGVTTQQRDFIYDSLSRLTSATNPESGQISYKYDQSNNLIVKTDARLSVHYSYDALNRITRRWYNASNSVTATTHNSPALPAAVGATDEIKFYYDAQALPAGAPSFSRGTAIGRLVATTYAAGSNGDYFGYDLLGRATLKIQQIGAINYQMGAAYNLASAQTSLTYPSGRTITNSYDPAGRLTGFSGNLGDGTTRTYATGILYSPAGAMAKEQFGTTTPVYNKLFYNSRAQLAEIRASTSYTGPTDFDSNRGAIINNYSNQCTGICSGSAMTDNNGNLLKQEIHVPNHQMRWQQYEYDSLNRLESAREVLNGGAEQWKQQFTYDRWGNRIIDAANTYGTAINEKAFTVNASNNRLGVPAGQPGVMTYDGVGNLVSDTYTGAGNRTYDGENKITSAWGGNNQAQLYKYDGSGQRIKRIVNGVETWQVYGFGGELVAEYGANGATGSPQKEYGYRNGQLLLTASPASSHSLNLNGTSAYMQAPSSSSLNVVGPITVEAWIKINAIGANRAIVSREAFQQSGTGGGYRLSITDTGKVRLDLFQTHNTYVHLSGATTITPGVWHHVAGVFDGSQVRVYLNGVLDGTLSTSNGPTTGTGNLHIGRFSYAFNPYYFNGLVDEARVSNAALYSSSFTPQSDLTASGSTKGLWKFDGQSSSDSSGNSNTLTIQGGATYASEVPGGGGSAGSQINWLITDHLGTPRIIVDLTGSLANVKRHDYLPFGEELFAGMGGRTTVQGYSGGDGVRQQFTLKERDVETGLDYFLARYYSSIQGRFTSPDEFSGGPDELYDFVEDAADNPTFYSEPDNPQSLNKYQYTYNNPLRYTDPDGHCPVCPVAQRIVQSPTGQQVINAAGAAATTTVVVASGALKKAWDWFTTPNPNSKGNTVCGMGLDCSGAYSNQYRNQSNQQNDSNNQGQQQGQTQNSGDDRAGKDFTKKGKEAVIEQNKAQNKGQTKCSNCGTDTVPGQQSRKGVSKPANETQVDHIIPKSKGGQGRPDNGTVLCRKCNQEKSNKMPEQQ